MSDSKWTPVDAGQCAVSLLVVFVGIPLIALVGLGVWEMSEWIRTLPH